MRRGVPTGIAALVLTTGLAGALGGSAVAETVPTSDGASETEPTTEPVVTMVQRVEPRVVLEALRDESTRLSPKGTNLWEVSASGSYDVPEAALRAYKNAAATMAQELPSCDIPWTLIAGIGRVESDHGRYGGSVLGSDGVPRPAIRGIALNGVGPVAAIRDSDNGRFDGDKVWDRAVGPMQFIPTTWQYSGRDGDGDGLASPNDIDDAALAAADYLCPSSGSILPTEAMRSAIFSYNHSDYYVDLVMAFEEGYRTGVFVIPSPPPPPGAGDGLPKPGKGKAGKGDRRGGDRGEGRDGRDEPRGGGDGRPGGGGGGGGTGGGGNGGGGGGGGGGTTPSPTPTPTPPSPTYSVKSGALSACGGGYCLGGKALDLGSAADQGRQAAADLDGDTTTESWGQELAGLAQAGGNLQVTVQDGTTPMLVTAIEGHSY